MEQKEHLDKESLENLLKRKAEVLVEDSELSKGILELEEL